MNESSPLLAQLALGAMLIFVMTFGIALMFGGPKAAKKVMRWELKKLSLVARWTAKQACLALGKIFFALAKACEPKKKKPQPLTP